MPEIAPPDLSTFLVAFFRGAGLVTAVLGIGCAFFLATVFLRVDMYTLVDILRLKKELIPRRMHTSLS